MKALNLGRLWIVLVAGPILFLLAIVAASFYFAFTTQGNVEAIPDLVANSTPFQLVVVQFLLLMILMWAMKRDRLSWKDIGWHKAEGQSVWREALIGVVPGVALGLLYIFILSPLLTTAQLTIGDYVPAGVLLPTMESAIIPFFIANVVFAPFVEEGIYRGYALTRMFGQFSTLTAIVISCVFFGLLHWTGGFWYVLLTGIAAGGTFAALFVRRRNIIAPFTAHLALNIVEFLFVVLRA